MRSKWFKKFYDKWCNKDWNERALERSDHDDGGKPGLGPWWRNGCKPDPEPGPETIILTGLSTPGTTIADYDAPEGFIFDLTPIPGASEDLAFFDISPETGELV